VELVARQGQGLQSETGTDGLNLSQLIGHFVGRVVLGTVGFVALAIPAVLLSVAAHYLSLWPVSPPVVNVLLWVHYSSSLIPLCSRHTYCSRSTAP
jgi:hypothetical protein